MAPRARWSAPLLAATLVAVAVLTGAIAPSTSPSVRAAADPDAAPSASGFSLTDDGISPAAISLTWAASTETYFTNYTILYSTVGASGPWSLGGVEGSASTTTAVVSSLEPSTPYWWQVTAYYKTGLLGLGGTSSDASTVLAAAQPPVATLTSPANTSTSVQLNWTNAATYGGGITFHAYAVEEDDDGTTSTFATLTAADDNSTTVTGLVPGHSYSFYVETEDACAGCVPDGDSITESNVLVAGTATSLSAVLTSTRSVVDVGLPDGFACTPAGGTPPYTFHWNYTNGSTTFSSGAGTTSHAFLGASAKGYTVTCEVVDHASDRAESAVSVVVNPDPRVSVTVAPQNVTEGSAVRFACRGSPGTAPLHVNWTLGNGNRIVGTGAFANGTASYASSGTYVAECVVTDALGLRAVASVAVNVHARPAFAWLTAPIVLALAAAVGAVALILFVVLRRRREHSARSSAMSRWLPPTGPSTTVHGSKVCPKCGAANVPLRRTCHACGTPLP